MAPGDRVDRSANSWQRSFWFGSIDLAPVGLFRIVFGVMAIGSVLDLLPLLDAGFSERGFLAPARLPAGTVPRLGQLGLPWFGGPPWLVHMLWAMTVAAFVAFILGFHARLAAALGWLLFSGFTERAPTLFDGSDQVLKLALFWSIFIPIGHRYSVDAVRARARGRPLTRVGDAFPVRILQLQIAWIYLSTFLLKLPGETWHDGTAVYLALGHVHYFTRPLGYVMLHFPWTTKLATYFTLAVESSFLALVFLPVLQPRAKAVALSAGTIFHAGILATMCIGGFSWVMLGTYPLFFEPAWAERTVAWVRRRLWPVRTSASRAPRPLQGDSSIPRASTHRSARVLRAGLHAVLGLTLLACMWSSAPLSGRAAAPPWVFDWLAHLELAQQWNMFAPNPGRIDFWLRGPGELVDGSAVDVLRGDQRGGPLPPAVHGWFGSRWAFVNELVGWGDAVTLRAFGDFLCRHWNEHPPPGRASLAKFEIRSVQRQVPLPGEVPAAYHEVPFWQQTCPRATREDVAKHR